MIFPILEGFFPFSRAPVTWLLLLLNFFLFSQVHSWSESIQAQIDECYEKEDFLQTQGRVYRQYLQGRAPAQIANHKIVGRLAFRDQSFIDQALTSNWSGDQIAIAKWKKDLTEFTSIRAHSPSILLGVSTMNPDWFHRISYQFYHEGLFHLLGNALLLLLVGGFLEQRVSALYIFSTYVVGGALAALFYETFQGLSGAPLIGASGSVCALLGLLAGTQGFNKTRLIYFVFPSKSYMGFVTFPTFLWVIWLLMLEDVAGILSQSPLLGSFVAHWVHLYGFSIGLVMGLLYLQAQKLKGNLSYKHQTT